MSDKCCFKGTQIDICLRSDGMTAICVCLNLPQSFDHLKQTTALGTISICGSGHLNLWMLEPAEMEPSIHMIQGWSLYAVRRTSWTGSRN